MEALTCFVELRGCTEHAPHPPHPSMKMCEEVRLTVGDAELMVRYVGFACDVALAVRRYNGVVRRGSAVSMGVCFEVFAASRSRLSVSWNYGICVRNGILFAPLLR